jgi:tRNA A-37 threonylcarbamoyl transferase component Bud32
MPTFDCVTEADLRSFLLGELPDSVARLVTEHLETCSECTAIAQRLDDLADPFLGTLRQALSESSPQPIEATATRLFGSRTDEATGAVTCEESLKAPESRTIAGYEILGELGRGGMSVVYKARQARPARLVAVKMILAGEHATAERRARFLAEADIIARLQHPNIVQIYEVGQQDGLPFLALELMDGGNLAQRLAGQPQDPNKAATLVEQLARAVHYAHLQGVIHRDLKPANVLRSQDGTVKISDFGLAKHERPELTATGAILGTPSYMAPEQAAGHSKAVGPPTDVYALGAILYEALTGQPPFAGTSAVDTLQRVRHDEPVPPSQCRAGIPRDVNTICLKCLHKEPERRYTSALDLADDLWRFNNGRPIAARPIGTTERTWRWARRNPGWAAMLASVVGILTVSTIVALALYLRAFRAETQTKERLFESKLAEARATSLSRQPGQRFKSLALIREASELARELELPRDRFHDLRNAAVTALAHPDVYPDPSSGGPLVGRGIFDVDDRLTIYARADEQGNCTIRRLDDDRELYFLPSPVTDDAERLGPWAFPTLSRNGRFLAVSQNYRRVDLWELGGPSPRFIRTDHNIVSVDFRPDGRDVAYSDRSGTISRYELPSGRSLGSLQPAGLTRDPVISLHPTEPLVAAASYFAKIVQVRKLENGAVVASLDMPKGGYSVAWHPAGHLLAASDGDGTTIHLFDHDTFHEQSRIQSGGEGSRLFFNHTGDMIAACDWAYHVSLIDVVSGRPLSTGRTPGLISRFASVKMIAGWLASTAAPKREFGKSPPSENGGG